MGERYLQARRSTTIQRLAVIDDAITELQYLGYTYAILVLEDQREVLVALLEELESKLRRLK